LDKRILILTQYYPPETGAPQNRLHSIAKSFHSLGWDITVLTAMPSYPKNKLYDGYEKKRRVEERIDNIKVIRTWIYVSPKRSVFSRLLNYFSFVWSSWIEARRMTPLDVVFCESPPLFLGITAVLLKRKFKSKLVFNVSDLWPESAEKLNIVSNRLFLQLAYKLEAWIYENAFLISGQTKGIVSNIQSRFPKKNVIWFPNGVDLDFFEGPHEFIDWRKELRIASNDFVLLYAGIIGHAQGLQVILDAAKILKDLPIKFLIVGDGPEKKNLVALANAKALSKVIFQSNVKKGQIPSLIKTCDAYVVPLKRLDLFQGAVPSKLFEPLSLKKPILLGIDGEARELFIKEGKCGLYFEPENAKELATSILTLYKSPALSKELGNFGYNLVKQNFTRLHINNNYIKDFMHYL